MRTLQLCILAALVALVGCSRPVPEAAPVDASHVASAPLPPARDAGTFPMEPNVDARLREHRDHIARAMTETPVAADDRVTACTRNATDKASLMQCLGSFDAPKPDAGAIKFASARGPVPPSKTSWLVPAWFVNASTGSDDATGVTSGAPLKTLAELYARWQTTDPFITSVNITPQTALPSTDPLKTHPLTFPGGTGLTIQGTVATIGTGTLAGVVPKNTAAGQELQADLGASVATYVGQRICNSTHSSCAKVSRVISGHVARISQPVLPTDNFTEVDTWANGDAFTVSSMPALYAGDISGITLADVTLTASGFSNIFASFCFIVDSALGASTVLVGQDSTGVFNSTDEAAFGGGGGFILEDTGELAGGVAHFPIMRGAGWIVGNDVEISTEAELYDNSGTSLFGPAFLDTGTYVHSVGLVSLQGATYGNGWQFNSDYSTIIYATAATSFLGSGNVISIDNITAGTTCDLTHGPEQCLPGMALSISNLDTAYPSGFGGWAKGDTFGGGFRKFNLPAVSAPNLCSSGQYMTGNPSAPCGTPGGTGCATCTTITAGSGISVSGGPAYTVSATGSAVSSVTGTSGISCSPTTGAVSCTNTGVTSNVAGAAISVSSATGASTISLTPCSVNGQLLQTISGAQTCETLSQDLAWDSPVPGAFTVVGIQATPVPVPSGSDVGLHWNHSAGALSWNTEDVAGGGTGQTSLTSNALILGSGTSPVSFLTPAVADTVVGTTNGTTWSSFLPLPITSFAGGGAVNLTSAATYFSLASFSDTSTPTRTYSFIGNLSCSNAAAVRIKYGISVNSTSANTVELTMDIQGGTTEFNTGGINFAVATSGSNTFRFLAQDTTTVSSTCNGYLTMIKTVQ